MKTQYYLVNKKMLPDFVDDVIKIKEEIEEDNISVSTACEKHNLSRSTYYKYKDMVFLPVEKNSMKAIISFRALNKQGVLSSVLALFAKANVNIVTLNQDMPIKDYAFITVTIDMNQSVMTLDELIDQMKKQENIKKVDLIAFEG